MSPYETQYRIGVYRNHNFELVEHVISPYLAFAGMDAEFIYSDYDDALTFFNLDTSVNALIIWLDISRYKNIAISFFSERMKVLQSIYKKPIIFVGVCGQGNILVEQNILNVDTSQIYEELGDRFLDVSKERFTGTKLSSQACIKIAQILGTKYLPAALQPILKAIIVDLDNTLYKGVLGEDGIAGITLSKGHIKLQNHLKTLSQQGFFLCIASKNEIIDVENLFETRMDFPLSKKDFTKICASWSDKSDSISQTAAFLNIHPSSMLFIDDNPGELFTASLAHPDMKLLRAYPAAEKTLDVLEIYPGLLKNKLQSEDFLRSEDVKANQSRNKLRDQMSQEEYLKALDIVVNIHINPQHLAQRVSELSNKTNQFIFNYMRYQHTDILQRMQSSHSTVVTASLKDKLSDSGMISSCIVVLKNDHLEIEDLFVSCRALGRGLDEMIVLGSIQVACDTLQCNKIRVKFIKGERNTPAENFVANYLKPYIVSSEDFTYQISPTFAKIIINKQEKINE